MKKRKKEGKKNVDKNRKNTDEQIKINDCVSRRYSFAKRIHFR